MSIFTNCKKVTIFMKKKNLMVFFCAKKGLLIWYWVYFKKNLQILAQHRGIWLVTFSQSHNFGRFFGILLKNQPNGLLSDQCIVNALWIAPSDSIKHRICVSVTRWLISKRQLAFVFTISRKDANMDNSAIILTSNCWQGATKTRCEEKLC